MVDEGVFIDFATVYDFTQMSFAEYLVDVVVFSNKEHHDDYLRQLNIDEDEIESSWASWHSYPYKINGMGVRKEGQKNLGRLTFIAGSMNIEVVSHEIQHMINMWVDMDLANMIDEYDEHISIVTGRFYKRFYDWFYKVELDK